MHQHSHRMRQPPAPVSAGNRQMFWREHQRDSGEMRIESTVAQSGLERPRRQHLCACVQVCVCVCVQVCVCVCVCVYIQIYHLHITHACMHACMHVHVTQTQEYTNTHSCMDVVDGCTHTQIIAYHI